jgi:putative serine protease PepD
MTEQNGPDTSGIPQPPEYPTTATPRPPEPAETPQEGSPDLSAWAPEQSTGVLGYATPSPEPRPANPVFDSFGPADTLSYPVAPPPAGGMPPQDPYATAAPPARERPSGAGRLVAVALAAGLLAGIVGGAGGYVVAQRSSTQSVLSPGTTLPQSNASLSTRPDGSIASVAAAVTPSVVSISVRTGQGGDTGSGVILTSDGYILTNNHVVEAGVNGGQIEVTFSDGSTKPATIVGRDTYYDLAVVKVDASGLPAANLGNSDDVVVGDTAIAIGSPLGLSGTVTAGIISSVDRPVTAGGEGGGSNSFINAIQTDAPINPGNSGGALVDAQGKVIGINSAIASLGAAGGGQSGSIGLGFAIPINQAKRIADELISTGHSTHPVVGVTIDQTFAGPGVRIQTVTPGGPADQAGIKAGDVVTAVDGKAVNDPTGLVVAIRAQTPGDTVTLTIKDGSGTREVKATLQADNGG